LDFLLQYLRLSNQFIKSGSTYFEIPCEGILYGDIIIDIYELNCFDKEIFFDLQFEILRNINLYFLFKNYKLSDIIKVSFQNIDSLQNIINRFNYSIFNENITDSKSNLEDSDDYYEKLYEFQFGIIRVINKTNKKFTRLINELNNDDYYRQRLLEYVEVALLEPMNIISNLMKKSKNLNQPEIYRKLFHPLKNSVRDFLTVYEMKLKGEITDSKIKSSLTAQEKNILKNFLLYESNYYEMQKIISDLDKILFTICNVYKKNETNYDENKVDNSKDKKAKDYIAEQCSRDKIKTTTDFTEYSINFCLKKFIKPGNELVNYEINLENFLNIEYLNPISNLMKIEKNGNWFLYCDKLLWDYQNNQANYGKLIKFLVFTYVFGIFDFIKIVKNFLNEKSNDHLLKMIIFALNFIRLFTFNQDSIHDRINYLMLGYEKDKQIFDYNYSGNYPYTLLDVLFAIKELLSYNINSKISSYNEQLIKIYDITSSLVIQIISQSHNKQLTYFSKIFYDPYQNTLCVNSFYYLSEMIYIRNSLSDNPFIETKENPLLGITYSNFLILNSLLNCNWDNYYIINHIEMIFPPSFVINLFYQSCIYLFQKYLNLDPETIKNIDAKICKKFKSKYLENSSIFNDKIFQISCQFFIYLKTFQVKYGNKYCENIFKCQKDLIVQKSFEEFKLTYYNKILEKQLKSIQPIINEDFSKILQSSKLIIKLYSRFVLSCEFILEKTVFETFSTNSEKERCIKYLKSLYFIQDPRFTNLDKDSILKKVFYRGIEALEDRITLLFEDTHEYLKEAEVKSQFISEGKYNKTILEINYSSINMINLILTTLVISILLIFLNINNKQSSVIYSFIFYSQAIQMLFNLVFIGLYCYSKYRIFIKLDDRVESIKDKNIFDYIDIYVLKSLILNEDVSFLIVNVIFELILFFNPTLISLLCLQLLMIIKFVPTIKDIFTAFAMKFDQLMGMVLFLAIIIFIYANFAFLLIKDNYLLDVEGGEQENVCEDLISCAIFHFDTGVRSGGGIGDSLNMETISNLYDYSLRYVGDLMFFICVILLVLNMINGIIITTFSQLREDNEKLHEGLDNKCYICGESKDKFEEKKGNFSLHLKDTHNYINYIKFFCYLKNKPRIDYNKDEVFLDECHQEKRVYCFPVKEKIDYYLNL
jgi:hypothetical protein